MGSALLEALSVFLMYVALSTSLHVQVHWVECTFMHHTSYGQTSFKRLVEFLMKSLPILWPAELKQWVE